MPTKETEATAMKASKPGNASYLEAVQAIRLALVGSTDPSVQLQAIQAILDKAPVPMFSETGSVRVFIEAVREIKGTFEVTDHVPRGRVTQEATHA